MSYTNMTNVVDGLDHNSLNFIV